MQGTFTVGTLGQVEIDFIYDGGWFEGELIMFSLEGIDAYQIGSLEYIQEATRRALTNSTEGYVVISDADEGAKFGNEYNQGDYEGVKTFEMNAGDEVGFILLQHTTAQDIYENPSRINQWGKKALYSMPEGNGNLTQAVAVDNNGTIAFEDIEVNKRNSDQDYQDFIFQVRGAEGDLPLLEDNLGAFQEDWRNSTVGQKILAYTDRHHYSAGVFEVGDTGEISFDFLYDGGWFRGELAIFNLAGMEYYTPGSNEFILEAANRALTNSTYGYVLVNDRDEGAKFNYPVWWESNFNQGEYQGVKTFTMNAGDEFAVMLVQNNTVQSVVDNIYDINRWGNLPIFSLPEANLGINQGVNFDADEDIPDTLMQTALGQFVGVDNNGVYALEDIRLDQNRSDQDYNDFVFQLKGATTNVQKLENVINPDRGWLYSDGGQELLSYANRATFEQGFLEVDESGTVIVDFLIDAGDFQKAEVGVFSLEGLEAYEMGTDEFKAEVVRRVQSNSKEGYLIIQDTQETGRFPGQYAWENTQNNGQYQGKQVLEFDAGDKIGLVLIPDASFEQSLTAKATQYRKQPLYSMNAANLNDTAQIAQLSGVTNNVVLAFEDIHLNAGLEQNYSDAHYMNRDRDYNDIVIGIQGVTQGFGFQDVNELTQINHDWSGSELANQIINTWATGEVFLSESDAGKPRENTAIPADVDDGDDVAKLEFTEQYYNPNGLQSTDILTGTALADQFVFKFNLNAPVEVYSNYQDINGVVDWEALTTENDNYNDYWLEGIGYDVINNFGAGDELLIAGYSDIAYEVLSATENQVILGLYSDQAADRTRGNEAHDFDVLGVLEVNHDGNFNLNSDVNIQSGVYFGDF